MGMRGWCVDDGGNDVVRDLTEVVVRDVDEMYASVN